MNDSCGFYGNVWWRLHGLAKVGDVHAGHTHPHDHVTLLLSGAVRIAWHYDDEVWAKIDQTGRVRSGVKEYSAKDGPVGVPVKAECCHEITALEDGTRFMCLFALRDVDGSVVDYYDPSAWMYEGGHGRPHGAVV